MRDAETILNVIRERGRRGLPLTRHRSLESHVRLKNSCVVWGGAVEKVPARETRRRPTLRHVRFGGGVTVPLHR